jgi:hypothetical protein
MPPQNLLKVFVHRFNENGSADSICLFCFATVASRPKEHELDAPEGDHFCWQRQDGETVTKPFLMARQEMDLNSFSRGHEEVH